MNAVEKLAAIAALCDEVSDGAPIAAQVRAIIAEESALADGGCSNPRCPGRRGHSGPCWDAPSVGAAQPDDTDLPPYEDAPPEENFWDDRTHREPELDERCSEGMLITEHTRPAGITLSLTQEQCLDAAVAIRSSINGATGYSHRKRLEEIAAQLEGAAPPALDSDTTYALEMARAEVEQYGEQLEAVGEELDRWKSEVRLVGKNREHAERLAEILDGERS